MNKKILNDSVFSIQGVNPSFNVRDETQTHHNPPATTPGKVVLKRKQLLACPYLPGDDQIKLLNLQKNCIVKIANLDHLTSLVVLDLCENEIDLIQGLESLTSLRILRLAKNKIRQIKNLDALTQLDVLDLNENQISRIENCKHLVRLRVLNLAYNRIEKCENLRTLQNLVELNLQGNLISIVCDLETLPIQRLYLSFNKIRRYDDIRCISKLTSLEEISLEGNPLAFTKAYEQIILSQSQQSSSSSTIVKQDLRQPMNIENRVNRVMRMQHANNNNNMGEIRERPSLDNNLNAQQDSMSERSDTEGDTTKPNLPSNSNRSLPNPLQKTSIKHIQDTQNPLLVETKLSPIISERTTVVKTLVQSAMDDAFRKESTTIRLARCWPLLLTRLIND